MQHPLFNLLCPSLVPELGSDIPAGPPGYIHFILPAAAAARALPDQLSVAVIDNADFPVIAALLAVIALGVQLGIHNIVINIFHDR